MGWPLDLNETTIVDDLNDAGFETALVGVNHERHPRTDRYRLDMTEDWDDWKTENAVTKALDFLKTRDRSKPLFLNVGSQNPHASTWRTFEHCADPPEKTWIPVWMQDTESIRSAMGKFQASIRYMDEHFGRFVKGLIALGYGDNTIIVFTTDHGISGPRSKGFLYDRGLELTLMIRLPGASHGGERRQQLVANVDFRPTWLDLLGIPAPNQIQGTSFARAITQADWPGQGRIFAERNFHGEKLDPQQKEWIDLYDPIRSIRTRDFHYIRNFKPELRPAEPLPFPGTDPSPRPAQELYDLRHDPQELVNLAERPEYADIIASLSDQLLAWMRESGDFALTGPVPERPEAPGWGPNWHKVD